MAMLKTLLSLVISATVIKLAMATNYIVGGPSGGWDTTTDLQTWESSQSFSVGDKLIFQYAPNHDVLEVSKADYDGCQAGNAIQSFSGGSTTIPLSAPGKRYFICGTPAHCAQGMKLEIATLASSPSAQPPASLVTPLVPSLAPEISTSSPIEAPRYGPTVLPPSPVGSAFDTPASSSIIPSAGSTRTSSTGSSTEVPSSSAHSDSSLVNILIMGFSFGMMMLQA